LDNERIFILSGAIHYQRIHPSDWVRALSLAVEAGLNTVQSYVFWNQHEVEQGIVDFSGNNNISSFIQTAASLSLNVVVRIGPYACAEHFAGGTPVWMFSSSGSNASCFRCTDPVWLAYSNRVLTLVVNELKDNSLLYPQGGNVIALQVENEYNGNEISYLIDVVDQALAATRDVPWLLCHDLPLCTIVNQNEEKALCTINGFWEDDSAEGVQQPSPAWANGQVKGNPTQPLAWTEDQGWFDQWGVGQRVRRTSDILYGFSRAIAYGLTWHNFYMFTGGSNFGYQAAEGVTTAYANDVAVDSYLLRHEPKFTTVGSFHRTIQSISNELMSVSPQPPVPVGTNCEVSTYGSILFISNKGWTSNESETLIVNGSSFFMPNHTVVILCQGQIVFNTSAASDELDTASSAASGATTRNDNEYNAPVTLSWSTITEKLGQSSSNKSFIAQMGENPFEMLNLTRNLVDYMWYSLPSVSFNASELKVTTCGGEYVYVYSNYSSTSSSSSSSSIGPKPLKRLSSRSMSSSSTTHSFAFADGATSNGIDILISAMGVNTFPSPTTCKGIQKVFADSVDLTKKGWVSSWIFKGEEDKIYTNQGAASANWSPVDSTGGDVPISWFKTLVDLPSSETLLLSSSESSHVNDPQPQLSYALDLLGATKGVAWVNGFNVGRYNLELGVCNGSCAPPMHGGHCYIFYRNCNEPTQRFYHVPTSILQPTGNLLVLFEETATVPVSGQGPVTPSPPPRPLQLSSYHHQDERGIAITLRNLSSVKLVALTSHP